ncbi:MAG TPA: hypothetical protein VK539_01760 [Myxococcaceae bacterium]|nr:hypothetical protein [Myxococcaceae bacterium]
MEPRREWVSGTCRAYFEEPDVLLVHPGPTSLETAQFLVELYRELGTRRPLFLLLKVEGDPLSMEARGYFRQHLRTEWFRCVFIIGASIMTRALGKALYAGGVFVRAWTAAVYYVDTEEEARTRVAQLRAEQPAPPG